MSVQLIKINEKKKHKNDGADIVISKQAVWPWQSRELPHKQDCHELRRNLIMIMESVNWENLIVLNVHESINRSKNKHN